MSIRFLLNHCHATSTGVFLSPVVPSPSCPPSFQPQHQVVPSLSTAQVKKYPAEIHATSVSPTKFPDKKPCIVGSSPSKGNLRMHFDIHSCKKDGVMQQTGSASEEPTPDSSESLHPSPIPPPPAPGSATQMSAYCPSAFFCTSFW